MAFGEFYVERQGWARWPKVLIMCRKRGADNIERKRYVPERTYKTKTKEECAGCPDEHEVECRALWTHCWKDELERTCTLSTGETNVGDEDRVVFFTCSSCGNETFKEYLFGDGDFVAQPIPKYCPYCGARVKEVDNADK